MQRKSHSHLAAGALCDRRYLGEEGKDGVKVDEVDEVDEVDVADVAGVALALYAAERIVRTHHILAAVQAAARFEDNAFRGCQTWP